MQNTRDLVGLFWEFTFLTFFKSYLHLEAGYLWNRPHGDGGGELRGICIPMRVVKGDRNGAVSRNNHKKGGLVSVLGRTR